MYIYQAYQTLVNIYIYTQTHTHTLQSYNLLVANDIRLCLHYISDTKERADEYLSFVCHCKLLPLIYLLSSRLYIQQTFPY